MDLIQYLVKEKVLNKKDGQELQKGLEGSEKTAEDLVLEKKLVDEQKLFELKGKLLGVPFKKALPEVISPDAASIIPRESVAFYKMIPFSLNEEERVLDVGMVYPENPQAQQALSFLARQQKLSLRVFLITISDFKKYITEAGAPEKEMERALEKLEEEVATGHIAKDLLSGPKQFERLVEEAPIIKMVAVILRQAVEQKASDIHIEPGTDSLKVRFRVDGVLHLSLLLPLKVHPAVVTRIKILSALKIDETRLPQDGRFSAKVGDRRIDFRVSTFPTSLGEKVAIRILDPKEGLMTLEELGLQKWCVGVAQDAVQKSSGMILVTGPTGSGKTTTLYTFLGILNKPEVNIVTLEDPVEYFVEGVNQSQVKPEINYTFARGLRQILRQDPDIIMVGEVRDEETAALAIHAALTGHLVLTTLHTTGVAGIIPRLVDMQVKPFLIPPTLALAVSQRLVRKLCQECREKVKVEGDLKNYLVEKIRNFPEVVRNELKLKEPFFTFQPKGCKKCNFNGYSGRIGIFEVMKMSDNLARIIAQRIDEREIFQEMRRQGMISMEEDGILKALQGTTSLEEVIRVAEEK